VQQATEAAMISGKKLRTDTTAVETNIHYPTDSSLLADALRVMNRYLQRGTTNPIESTFATVGLRTHRTKGSGSRIATLTMVFKLGLEAQKHWRRL
jgi:IS5 family transposase